MMMDRRAAFVLVCAVLINAVGAVNPDSGIVIHWAELNKIVANYTPTAKQAWLPPPTGNCTAANLKYRPLFCPWMLKPFRDPFDLVDTETQKWPVYQKLMGVANVSQATWTFVGLPVTSYFGVECCRVYRNATDAFEALGAYDPCWFATDELERCAAAGHAVPRARATALSDAQYAALVKNMSYADAATPHL